MSDATNQPNQSPLQHTKFAELKKHIEKFFHRDPTSAAVQTERKESPTTTGSNWY